MDNLIMTLLIGAGTAISALATFIAFLFKAEKMLNEQLRQEMRDDDKQVRELVFDIRRHLNEAQASPNHKELYEHIRKIERDLQKLLQGHASGRKARTSSAGSGD